MLFSGGIGNVVIPYKMDDVIVIPQSATYELQDKVFAYKVQENGKLSAVQLQIEKLNDGTDYIVRSGLQPGDRIVSEGVGLLQDGMEILVKETEKQ